MKKEELDKLSIEDAIDILVYAVLKNNGSFQLRPIISESGQYKNVSMNFTYKVDEKK